MIVAKKATSPDYGMEIDDDGKVDLPAANARQGVTRHNVRYVLGLGLAGVITVFAIVYLAFFWF